MQRHTADGALHATSALLRPGDFSAAWKAQSSNGGALNCNAVLAPNESDLVEAGQAVSPLFTRGATGAVTQTVRTFATTDQANTAWKRTVTKKLVICMEQQAENTSTMGAAVSVIEWSQLRLPKLIGHVAGFRVVASAKTTKSKSTNVYFDLLELGNGRSVTRIVLSSLDAPFSKAFEERLVRTISGRLTTG